MPPTTGFVPRVRAAFGDLLSPPEGRTSSQIRASGLLVALLAVALIFGSLGAITRIPIGGALGEVLYQAGLLVAGAGMCCAGVGGYRLILGGSGEGTSALRSMVRIGVAVFSILFVLFASLALLGVARDLRRARQPVEDPTSTSTAPESFEVR
jgi:hypothetical protein